MTPVNITEDIIERYDTFNTKGFTEKLIFGNFNDQNIPSNYYNSLNYDYDNGKNITGNPVDNTLPENKGVEDAVVPNNEYIND